MTKTAKLLSEEEWIAAQRRVRAGAAELLFAMYSGVTGGITTDPALMNIPVDDHLPQRGDGVFESLKCLNGQLYNAAAHFTRLERSARGIGMELPCTHAELLEIIKRIELPYAEPAEYRSKHIIR